MVTLADLRVRNIQPAWQEGVAVVQELVQTINATGAALPDLDHVALIPNGDVVALPGSLTPEEPVRQAALMLQTLVESGPTPPELAQFIERNLTTPGQSATLADFARNLSFYERPGRRADIERLVARAMTAAQNSRAEEELRRLKERTLENEEQRLQGTVFSDTVAMTGRRRPALVLIGLAAVALLLLVGGWWLWQRARAPQAPVAATAGETDATPGAQGEGATAAQGATGAQGAPGAAAAPQPSLIDRAATTVKSAVDKVMGATEAPPAPVAAVPPPLPPPPSPKKRYKPAAPAATPGHVALATSAEPVAIPPNELPPPVVLGVEPVDDAVYSPSDSAVIPPVLVRPVLPRQPPPGVPESQIGTIELVVDEQGDVERVRLISPANRFYERMLVSAAKMWKFRPAFRDGHPVRYRTRVRLTV